MLSCEVGESRIVYVDMAQSRQRSAGFMPVDVLLCWNLMLWFNTCNKRYVVRRFGKEPEKCGFVKDANSAFLKRKTPFRAIKIKISD